MRKERRALLLGCIQKHRQVKRTLAAVVALRKINFSLIKGVPMIRFRFLFLLNLFLSGVAFGQTACAVGVAPGSPQCGPDSGTSRGDIPDPPPRPTGEWLKTWGAIAGSNANWRERRCHR